MNAVSWNESCSSNESSEDSLEELKELESRLYSVIHYNNLSETIPSDLPEGIKIDISKSNELTVSLTNYNRINDSILNKYERRSELGVIDSCGAENWKDKLDSADKEVDESNQSLSTTFVEAPVKVPYNILNCTSVSKDGDEDDDDVVIIETVSVAKKSSHHGSIKSDCVNNKMKTATVDSSHISLSNNILDRSTSGDSESPTCVEPSLFTDQNDLITNINQVAIGKKPEEIVISSDETVNHETNNSTPERSKVKSKKKKKIDKQCPKKWNSSMLKFYNKISRKKLNFDSMKLIKEMRETVGREGWFLNEKDISGRLRRQHNKRCPRCRQFGHDPKNCTEHWKPITCNVCGEIGHRENRCPQRKCFTCGRPNSVFVQMCSRCLKDTWNGGAHCSICNGNGHQENLCPDIWRGFHLTTKEGTLVFPLSEYKLRKFCCNCAEKGHLDYECGELRSSVYCESKPTVSNYLAVAHMFAKDKENLTVDIRLNAKEGRLLGSEEGYEFLQNLSNSSKARLELILESPTTGSLILNGSQTQCKAVLDSVQSFVERKIPNYGSFHKHKKKSVSKKRRTI